MQLHSWKATKTLASKPQYRVDSRSVTVTKETRRILRNHYREARKLARIEKLRRFAASKVANDQIRSDVKSLRQANRSPKQRVRTKDQWVIERAPTVTYTLNGRARPVSAGYFPWGVKQSFVDIHPVAKLDPPRNAMHAQKYWANSLSSSMSANVNGNVANAPKGRWALNGLLGFTIQAYAEPLDWSWTGAERALSGALAKVNEADLHMNEYVVEFKQFTRLLKDPCRTLAKSMKTLKKWYRADAWIFVPKRRLHKDPNREFVNAGHPGDILMSMRTRRTVSTTGVSASLLQVACNRWLQYRYGIAPLAADVATAIGMWGNPTFKQIWLKERVRVWMKKETMSFPFVYSWTPFAMYFTVKVTSGTSYSAVQYYKIVGDEPSSYALGLHTSQFAQTLWNAIPWSFVVDWGINIDEWLSSVRKVPWIHYGPNCITGKEFVRVVATQTKANLFGLDSLPVTTVGFPLSTKCAERVMRKIDIPRPSGPSLDRSWQSLKNLLTAETLVISQIFKKQR